MLKKISNLEGVHLLEKSSQKQINGGLPPECPVHHPNGCFTGPFYCNIHGLPICKPLDETN